MTEAQHQPSADEAQVALYTHAAGLLASPWFCEPGHMAALQATLMAPPGLVERAKQVGLYRMQRPGVAVIEIVGVTTARPSWFSRTNYVAIEAACHAARLDAGVEEVIFLADSPGGQVSGLQEVVAAIELLSAAKPTTMKVTGYCCSACVWMAMACRRRLVTPTAMMGCIGAAVTYTKSTGKGGIFGDVEIHEFVSALTPNKRPDLSNEDHRSQIQRQVDDLGRVFLTDLARLTGMESAEAVAEAWGGGDSYVGQAAVDRGLADAIALSPFEDAPPLQESPGRNQAATQSDPAASREGAVMSRPEPQAQETQEAPVVEAGAKAIEEQRDAALAEVATLKERVANAEKEAASLSTALETERSASADLGGRLSALEERAAKAEQAAATAEHNRAFDALLADGSFTEAKRKDYVAAALLADGGNDRWFKSEFGSPTAGSAWPGRTAARATHSDSAKKPDLDEARNAQADIVEAYLEKTGQPMAAFGQALKRISAHANISGCSFEDAAAQLAGGAL